MIRSPAAILGLLTGLNLLNYLDRYVLSAVLPRLIVDLGLTNLEAGLLATVFLLGYFVTSPIFGALGDRLPRKGLIALGILIWSAATIASGLASNIMLLLAARAMVGVGEASYATLAPTVIDDITPTERKGRALSIFYIATPVGSALGFIIGGIIEKLYGWHAAFFVAGVPGIVLALVMLFIEEPQRKPREDKPDILRDLGTLSKVKLYRQGVLGYCAYTAAIGAFSFWAPQFLFKRYAMSLASANTVFGGIIVVAGALGTIIGGRWADAQSKKIDASFKLDPLNPERSFREQGYRDASPAEMERLLDEVHQRRVKSLLQICAVGSLVGAPLAVACFLSPGPTLFFAFAFFTILFLFLATSPVNAVILQSVPSHLRASAMALSIFAIHVLGDLWSPPAVGVLADHLPIQLAMMTLPLAIAASGAIWWSRVATNPEIRDEK
ncbi:MAG: MFS transporter [Labilithrix sp.]